MSRSSLIPLCLCLSFVVLGCMSGTDDSVPPTLQALRDSKDAADAGNTGNAAAPQFAASTDVVQSGIYEVEFITTEGKFRVEVNREWAPIGADRFYKLVKDEFFDDAGFFRVVPGFVVQFGLPADPEKNDKWSQMLKDEPVLQSNKRGYLTFAKSSRPNSRTTQLFISYADNERLDAMGFSAFGRVIEGMDAVDAINAEYGEQPQQHLITSQGNSYLSTRFPNLSYIQTARVVKDDLASGETAAAGVSAAVETTGE